MEIPDCTLNYPSHKTIQSPQHDQEYSVAYSIEDIPSIVSQKQSSIIDQQWNKQSPNQNYIQSFKPVIANEIYKKTKNLSWENRYFVLTKTRLVYFAKENMQEMKGCFNLGSLLQYKIEVICEQPQIWLTLKMEQQSSQKNILLKLFFSSELLYKQWSKALVKVIDNLYTSQIQDYPKVPKAVLCDNSLYFKNHFWNKLLITKEQFKNYANQLDIIFFKANGPLAYMNRMLMRSDYDHVGLLLRDQNNQIHIFEAIESRGVWTVNWDEFLQDFAKNYEEISYRKLILPPNYQISLKHLESYLNKLIGKKYELSFSKLFSNYQLESDQLDLEKKTFFCSELIANIYMKFNILKPGNSHSYWPKTFQQHLPLQNGAILSPMMKIEL